MSDEAWRRTERFPEHPETVIGNVSEEFINFLLQVHPDQDYNSATAALMCRQAYDIGREERKLKPNEYKITLHTIPEELPTEEMLRNGRVSLISRDGTIMSPVYVIHLVNSFINTLRITKVFTHWLEFPLAFPKWNKKEDY
jgi:hypothetical protein